MSIEELRKRAGQLRELMRECILCPRECKARRMEGEYGVCHCTGDLFVSSAGPHFGEEPPLVGRRGSGTIFFVGCNLKCQFCQNFEISQLRHGRPVSVAVLAETMLQLQRLGCHNINLVTPTPWVPLIVEALVLAAEEGLALPLVYNCGGYESCRTIELLDDIVDIYMPDIKYSDNALARKYSGAPNYWDIVRRAVKEMHRQVGELVLDDRGIARRGLLIRHLVMPNDIAGSKAVLRFVAGELSPNSYVNVMAQYRPSYRAYRYPELSRPVSADEFFEAVQYARSLGLDRGLEDLPGWLL